MRKCIHHLPVSRLEILFKKKKNFGLDNEVEDLIQRKRSILMMLLILKDLELLEGPRFDY
jgi:hypothetical protein